MRFIGHELRTPLNSVFMGMQLSIGQIPEDTEVPAEIERRETLLDTQHACGAALDILNEMLLFDRLESGSLVLHKQDVPVPELVEDSLKMFVAQAREKRIELTITNNDESMLGQNTSRTHDHSLALYVKDEVSVDKTKVIQVIRNVVCNAIKFTPASGKIQVNVRFEPCSDWTDNVRELPQIALCCGLRRVFPLTGTNNRDQMAIEMSLAPSPDPYRIASNTGQVLGELVIEIKDTGVGISEENQFRLFKEVVQFSPELLQNGGGSGLGMCISKSLMDMHGGTISVYSAGVGHGSMFTLRLPMMRSFSAGDSDVYTPRLFPSNLTVSNDLSASSPELNVHLVSPASQMLSVDNSLGPDILPATHTNSAPTREALLPDPRPAELAQRSLSFLVVDDSKMNRKMLCRLLQNKGHAFIEAEDGVQAVAMMTAALNASTPPTSEDIPASNTVMPTRPSATVTSVYDAVLMDFM